MNYQILYLNQTKNHQILCLNQKTLQQFSLHLEVLEDQRESKLSLSNILYNLTNMIIKIKPNSKDIFVDFHEVSFVISIPILILSFVTGASLVIGNNIDLFNLKTF